ncbi:MAG: LacI family DNA-binding transcriptional regulator [Gammaproteobacteria bacterium]|nr:LacI family DNA-binding transcriptional regulator [Gammaproteobacteria bacterium]MBU1441042.1 LacI family DNA-binding transcriptional regulator [Gammaproteobacteria bacterium]MBU2285119.1 LacI family DNA-binding transcriptional regulator [Gammaproteobacteria bacterium]MBU2410512.1 LacI family DNA-binding transcriptional regulator [Gammaproteobacteria bacterium]
MTRVKHSLTMRDVGLHAGVSPITVSRALANHASVTAETRAAVLRAATELGYVPDFTARALSRRGSKLVALLLPNIANSVFAETVHGINEVLGEAGFSLIIAHSGYSAEREEELIRGLLGYRPDAVILTGFTHTRGTRTMLRKAGMPVVETWNIGPEPIDLAVGFSNFKAGLEVTRYLISKGHRRLAYRGGTQTDNERTRGREEGFRQALAEANLPANEAWIGSAPMELESGAALAREFHAVPESGWRPQALFIASDMIAAGFVLEGARLGIRVPQDVAVAGFDDTPLGRAIQPQLTTVNVRQREIGRWAADLALRKLRGEAIEQPVHDVGFSIIHRESA